MAAASAVEKKRVMINGGPIMKARGGQGVHKTDKAIHPELLGCAIPTVVLVHAVLTSLISHRDYSAGGCEGRLASVERVLFSRHFSNGTRINLAPNWCDFWHFLAILRTEEWAVNSRCQYSSRALASVLARSRAWQGPRHTSLHLLLIITFSPCIYKWHSYFELSRMFVWDCKWLCVGICVGVNVCA